MMQKEAPDAISQRRTLAPATGGKIPPLVKSIVENPPRESRSVVENSPRDREQDRDSCHSVFTIVLHVPGTRNEKEKAS